MRTGAAARSIVVVVMFEQVLYRVCSLYTLFFLKPYSRHPTYVSNPKRSGRFCQMQCTHVAQMHMSQFRVFYS